jgi:hypothetical protein
MPIAYEKYLNDQTAAARARRAVEERAKEESAAQATRERLTPLEDRLVRLLTSAYRDKAATALLLPTGEPRNPLAVTRGRLRPSPLKSHPAVVRSLACRLRRRRGPSLRPRQAPQTRRNSRTSRLSPPSKDR